MSIAGIVVLYNPDYEVLSNIRSYIEELDVLYAFDNSDVVNEKLILKLKEMPRIKYISMGQNKGVSYALNYALKATKFYQFLLTMDQDSKFYSGMMKKYKAILHNNYSNDNSIAMYAVNVNSFEETNSAPVIVDHAITSGSVVNVQIANELGGFDDNLFIDEVDDEFCYRAQRHGYKILKFPNVCLFHHLGNPIQGSFFGRKFTAYNHNAIRKYYIIRNLVYVMKKYPEIRNKYCVIIIKYFFKTILAEPNKIERVTFMLRGVKDGIIGKMGKDKYYDSLKASGSSDICS